MMSQLVDIADQKQLYNLLIVLDPQAIPLWGRMKPQQMVEHLAEQVSWTNGKKAATCDLPADEASEIKQKWIYTDAVIPRNLVFVTLPDHFQYPDLKTAIYQLLTEIDLFHLHFKQPNITAIHGAYGPMDYQEWLIWHNKHFTHHLKQFNLI